ncbi:DUF4132 domain-containing protein [Actinoplanes sp. NPDC023801]|uniref:DUF4132 domain-containing protein n=1 Tax=Actinoplanes sp. NPDC023801 TaxID=3154595 RepID=UPI0033D5854C
MSFDLPEPWSSQLHPRRGGACVRPVEPDSRAREVVDGQMRELPVFVPGVIASALTDPALAAAGREWLDGATSASAEGAAVVAFAAIHLDSDEHERHPWFADLWLGERGVRFAAEAVVALFSLFTVAEGGGSLMRDIRRDGTEIMGVRRRRTGDGGVWALFSDPHMLMLLRIRAALAAAPDDVHEETVSALEPLRVLGPHARCATSVLVPSRSDWVTADWAEALAEPDSHDERIQFLRGKNNYYRASLLLNAISTPEQAAAALALPKALAAAWPGGYATLVDGLGPAAVPLLLRRLDQLNPPMVEREQLISLLAVLPDDGALGGLVGRAGQQDVRRALIEATGRFPERALRVLAVPAGKPVVSDLLAARVRADPALAERVADGLTGTPAARIRECLSDVAATVPAPLEALPPLLADPPWRNRRAHPPVVLDLKAPESPTGMAWAPGEREQWLSAPFDLTGAGDWTATADRLTHGETVDWREVVEFFVAGPEATARPLLADWKPVPAPDADSWMRRIVARFEADALLPLRRLAFHDSAVAGPLMLPFASPDVAWRMEARLDPLRPGPLRPGHRGQVSPAAHAWLERHPEFAARHLVPRAFGPDGRARRSAQHTLLYLGAAGHAETVRAVAASYGPEAASAAETLIAGGPWAILPVKLPAIPQWLDPTTLPSIRLRRAARPAELPAPPIESAAQATPPIEPAHAGPPAGSAAHPGSPIEPAAHAGPPAGSAEPAGPAGEKFGCDLPLSPGPGDSGAAQPVLVLPTGVLRDLVMVFALHDAAEPYPGVEIVRDACEPADLARFAWALFEAWQTAGSNSRQGWVLDALGVAGDDDTVRRLTPLIMEWPGQKAHARAVTGLGILARIGTDVALLHLNRVATRSRFNGIRSAAERQIAHVAERQGLSAEQLADRLIPDFGLDGDGSLVLGYGPRQFVVGFDEELKPFVVDGSGKRLKAMPKPGARDDAERADAACKRFATLKKDVRAIAADQVHRLERAMVTGRRWPAGEFRRFYAEHPLMRHLARRLLWGRFDAKGVLTGGVRVAEDGTFADVDDQVTTIADDELVGVVHPVLLAETLSPWSEIFADYRILQPFPQLGREIVALAEAEAGGVLLTRFQGSKVPSRAVLGLENRGWVRNAMRDSRTVVSISPSLADDLELDLEPGILLSGVDLIPEQTLGPIRLNSRTGRLGDLDPAVISEVIRDLELLTGGH